jgi:hypothetical protein
MPLDSGAANKLQLHTSCPFLSFDLITPAGAHRAGSHMVRHPLVSPQGGNRLHANLASERKCVKQTDSHVVVNNTGYHFERADPKTLETTTD